jgi:dTDP-4-amino-4,6-dideoxygalactose transaminase
MIPLSRPDTDEADFVGVLEALRSGNLVQGAFVERFEQAVASYLDAPHVIAVSSGTAALHLGLYALGVGPGHEVIVPAFTFPATANAVVLCGATPVMCDVDPKTCNLDIAHLDNLITPKTKVIIPVHEFGLPAEIGEIVSLAESRGVVVFEDAACAIGASYSGKKIGNFGLLAAFSLHPRKIVTTGEGGFIATHNAGLADSLRLLRNHGMRRGADGTVDFVCEGFNYRLTEFQAALGLAQLSKLDGLIAARTERARQYLEALAHLPLDLPPSPAHSPHIYQTFHIVLDNRFEQMSVVRALAQEGVASGRGAHALPLLTYHSRFTSGRAFPGAERLHHQGLALPLYGAITPSQVAHVCDALVAVLQRESRI